MSDIFKVWVDNTADPDQGRYLIENTRLSDYVQRSERIFPNTTIDFARNPRRIQEILYLDKPDVIITHQRSTSDIEQPVLAIEFSEQTPMGQNPYQRFPRAVAAAESAVPFIIMFPSKDWVDRERQGTSGWDYASPFIFNGLRKLTEFHGLPSLAVDWPFGDSRDPIRGFKCYDNRYRNLPDSRSAEARELFALVDIVLENTISRGNPRDLFRHRSVIAKINSLDEHRMARGAQFLESPPPRSGAYVDTGELVTYVNQHCTDRRFDAGQLPDHILSRPDSFIFSAASSTFRADPYTGTLLVYDYSFCRYGATRDQRHTNLIVHLPLVTSDQIASKYEHFYNTKCPFKDGTEQDPRYLALHLREGCRFTKQKELRVFFNFADIVILRDLVLF